MQVLFPRLSFHTTRLRKLLGLGRFRFQPSDLIDQPVSFSLQLGLLRHEIVQLGLQRRLVGGSLRGDPWSFEECHIKKKGSKIIGAKYQVGGSVLTSHVFELRG
jgi:hypothetical protein